MLKLEMHGKARLSVVMLALVAMIALGAGLAHAAPPFTVSIDEPVGVSVLTVTLSGTADSPAGGTHQIDIDWGDSNTDTIPLADNGPWTWGPIDHTYAAAGTYTITATHIHSQEEGNDTGADATDSVVVDVPGPVDPCVENPEAAECNVEGNVDGNVDGNTDGNTDGSTESTPPAEVLGKVNKKPLAKTANETTAILWAGLIMLMFGATIRFCAVTPSQAIMTEGASDDLVAKSLDLVSRLVRPRN
jgi:hypothetical protein